MMLYLSSALRSPRLAIKVSRREACPAHVGMLLSLVSLLRWPVAHARITTVIGVCPVCRMSCGMRVLWHVGACSRPTKWGSSTTCCGLAQRARCVTDHVWIARGPPESRPKNALAGDPIGPRIRTTPPGLRLRSPIGSFPVPSYVISP